MITASALITFGIWALVIIAAAVIVNWLVTSAPFMDAGLKQILSWLIWVLAGVTILLKLIGFL